MAVEKKVLLEAKSLDKTLRRFKHLKWEINKPAKNISLHINEGEILGILGPNGAGKSTTLRMITGELTPDAGSIIFDGKDITSWPMYKRCSSGLGYMPQEELLFKQMTVEENLIGIMQMQGFTKQECHERCEELMQLFDLDRIRHTMASSISGGEKHRLEVARALTRRPKLLVLDEPFAGVDPIVTKMITELAIDLCKTWGISILITDHDFRCIAQMIERCYVIFGGEVIFEGTPEEMINDDYVQQVYLGKNEDEIISVDEFGHKRVRSLLDTYQKKHTAIFQTSPQSSSQNNVSFLANSQNNQVGREREKTLPSENTASEPSISENVFESALPQETTADSELSDLLQPIQTNDFQTNELDDKPSATLADFIQSSESPSEETPDQTNSLRQRKFSLSSPTIKPFRRKR